MVLPTVTLCLPVGWVLVSGERELKPPLHPPTPASHVSTRGGKDPGSVSPEEVMSQAHDEACACVHPACALPHLDTQQETPSKFLSFLRVWLCVYVRACARVC